MALPLGALGLSAVCDFGISGLTILEYFSMSIYIVITIGLVLLLWCQYEISYSRDLCNKDWELA